MLYTKTNHKHIYTKENPDLCDLCGLLKTTIEPMKSKTADWFNSEEYNALEACCIKGGADARALPHFIKSLLSDQKQELLREGKEMRWFNL